MSTIFYKFSENYYSTPHKIAVSCDDNTLTYEQLFKLVKQWSASLQKRNFQRGDHIAVLLPNSIEYVVLMLVATHLGITLVPLNISMPSEAIFRACYTASVTHIIATSTTLKLLGSTLPIISISLDELYKKTFFTNNLYSNSKSEGQDNDIFILTMTSGSTGDPKPIILKQKTKLIRAYTVIKTYNISNNDVILVATPLYHSLAERLVITSLLIGGTLILMSRYSPSEWIRLVEEKSISFTIAVSSQLKQVAHLFEKESKQEKIQSLRCLVSSSALLDMETKEKLVNIFDCEIHECYGTSEVAISTNLNTKDALLKLHSVGKALPDVSIKILKDNNTIAAADESGEILCKTPMLFDGYYGYSEMTDDTMFGDYFCTGDIGKIDDTGFLYFLGRKKEIIITGGINVYPIDVETVISACSSVQESAAFAFPDDILGEVVAIALVPKKSERFELRKVRLHCAKHLADYQQPRKFFIVEELPKNSLGKIMKHVILSKINSI